MAAQVGSLFVSLSADVQPFVQGMSRAESTTTQAARNIERSAGVAERSVNDFSRSLSGQRLNPYGMVAVSRAFDNAADRASLLRGVMLSATGAFGGFTAALSTNVLLRYADSFTKANNQISVLSDSLADTGVRFDAVTAAANRSRSSLEATNVLYTRIQKSAPDEAPARILEYVETIQKALQMGGATAQESRSAAIQFSQAIASNRLGGEELRAILETPLGLELAKGLGVTIGQMRELGTEGKLTADRVLSALRNVKGGIDQQFARTGVTVDQALVVLDNRITDYIGKADKAYGVTRLLASGILGFGENLDKVVPALAAVGVGLGAAFAARNKGLIAGVLGAAVGGSAGSIFGPGEAILGAAAGALAGLRLPESLRAVGANASAAAEDLTKAKEAASGLREQLNQIRAKQTDLMVGDSRGLADKKATSDLARAQQAILSNSERAAALAQKQGEAMQKAGDAASKVTGTQVKLLQEQAAAEQRVISLNDARVQAAQRLRNAEEDLQQARVIKAATGTDATGGMTAQVKKSQAEVRALSKAIDVELAGIDARNRQIADGTSAAQQASAKAYISALKEVDKVNQEVSKNALAGDKAVADARAAYGRVGISGAEESSRQAKGLADQSAAVRNALAQQATVVGGLEAQTARTGRAMDFLRNSVGGLIGALGGPWGIAITAAIAGLGYFIASQQRAREETERLLKSYDEFIRRQSGGGEAKNASGAAASIARADAVKKMGEATKLASSRMSDFEAEAKNMQSAINLDDLGQKLPTAFDKVQQMLGKTGINAQAVVDAVAQMRNAGQNIDPAVERLEAMARSALGAKVEVENLESAQARLNTGRDFTGANDPMAALAKVYADFADETIKLAEVERLRAAGNEAGAEALQKYNAAQKEGQSADLAAFQARKQQLSLIKQIGAAYKQLADDAKTAALAEEKAAGDAAKAFGDFWTETRNKINNTRLKSQGREIEAKANEIFQDMVNKFGKTPGFDSVKAYDDAMKVARQQKGADDALENFEKAKRLAEAAREKIKLLREEAQGAFLGDIDRDVVKHMRQMKMTADEIKAYVDAAKTGDYSKISGAAKELRDIELIKKAGETSREVVKQYGTWGQVASLAAEEQTKLNFAVASGKITADQAKVAYADYLSQFGKFKWINQTADAFGKVGEDIAFAALQGQKLDDVLKNFNQTLQKIILQEAVGSPLRDLVKGIIGGGASGGGGLLASIGGSLNIGSLFGFNPASVKHLGGGFSGGTTRMQPAGAFAGAPRFHEGLQTGEFRAILQKGEQVMTRQMTRRTSNAIAGLSSAANSRTPVAGGSQVNIINYGPTKPEVREREDGSLDVIIPTIEQKIGSRAMRGRGLGPVMDARSNSRHLVG